MSEAIKVGDWARSTRNGEVGVVTRIREIREEVWAELEKQVTSYLKLPFVEQVKFLVKTKEVVRGVYTPSAQPRQNYRRPEERTLTHQNRNVTVSTVNALKKVSKISVSDLINAEVKK